MENFTRNTHSDPVPMPSGTEFYLHESQLPRKNAETEQSPVTPEVRLTDIDVAKAHGRHVHHLRIRLANGGEVALDARRDLGTSQDYEFTGSN